VFEIIGLLILLLLALLWFPYVQRTTKAGAPFVAMEPDVVERVMKLAEVKKGDVFYDLGSGDGRLVIAAALHGAQAYGVEIDWTKVIYSRIWIYILRLHKQAKIIHKNFFDINLKEADVVSLYLLQETNQKLKEKLKKELKPGTRIVSTAFTFEGWKPEKIDSRGTIYGPIYFYKKT
jgi:16S rRNA A1518/A1519 N6-dimethyltransferase RsmA/KsgA/DIM1 with predicted DNA glycosylase/AP lyase activity